MQLTLLVENGYEPLTGGWRKQMCHLVNHQITQRLACGMELLEGSSGTLVAPSDRSPHCHETLNHANTMWQIRALARPPHRSVGARFGTLWHVAQRSDGLPGGDRTPDPQLRRLMLYPTELRAEIESKRLWRNDGRGERIRTFDPLVPNQMRYQAALRPDMPVF